MRLKNKDGFPAAFRLGGHMYVSTDAYMKIYDKLSKFSIKEYERQADIALKERLEAGEDVNIRVYNAMKKETVTNLKTFSKSIRMSLESIVEDD